MKDQLGQFKSVPTMSDAKMDGTSNHPIPACSKVVTTKKRNRRKRVPLSCGECRDKKLSCDRKLPCQRCIRAGRPEQCSFETSTGQPHVFNQHLEQQKSQCHNDEIRDLRIEIAQLQALLSSDKQPDESRNRAVTLDADNANLVQVSLLDEDLEQNQGLANVTIIELSDPRERSPRGYYRQHTLLQFFGEIPQLYPFIKETTDEWLRPLGIQLKKEKFIRYHCKAVVQSQHENQLQHLLPSRDVTDALVSLYLNHLEQIHRIVHIPTFRREYENFWIPRQIPSPKTTALVLAMISISICVYVNSDGSISPPSRYRTMPVQWISACSEWLSQQSVKHRQLVHYQISCLLYLAKRVNLISKKWFWKDTGSLIQNAIMDGLHREPSAEVDPPYTREMKRRIWVTIRELDLQNSFEYGLPTLLHNIEPNVAAPANIDDECFDEVSEVLPASMPPSQHTCTSFQSHSSCSWVLRLEISRRVYSTGTSDALSYEDVLRYTHELTQAIHSLPAWNINKLDNKNGSKLLTFAYLQFQLQECILVLHRSYLHREDNKFWLSENVCYHMSRDMLLMNAKLAELGFQSLTLFREDLLLASLTLTRLTLLQSKASTSFAITNAISSIDLLEKLLPHIEERYMRCSNGEPWCFMTMCAAIMLMKIHLGKETWEAAKSSCARQFLDMHYKKLWGQQLGVSNGAPAPVATDLSMSWGLENSYDNIGVEPFALDVGVCDMWQNWEPSGFLQ